MPLTEKGQKILAAMKKQYGDEKGKQVFYASQNKGTVTGTHKSRAKARKAVKKWHKKHNKVAGKTSCSKS